MLCRARSVPHSMFIGFITTRASFRVANNILRKINAADARLPHNYQRFLHKSWHSSSNAAVKAPEKTKYSPNI